MPALSYPKISIVTPSFNQAEYLERTILSILGQNYPNLEYIIVDGGSTDSSVDIIKKYEKQLAYWVSEPDQGMYHAIQKGFEKSTGEIMAWSNSDDLYLPNAFLGVADIFTNFPQVEWLHGLNLICDEKDGIVDVCETRQWSKYYFLFGDYKWISQQSVFWRRSLWEKTGAKLDVKFRYAGDYELWSRMFCYAKLYKCACGIGIFRKRQDEQLSWTGAQKYSEEVKSVDLKILRRNTSIIKIAILWLIHSSLLKLPFVKQVLSEVSVFRFLFEIEKQVIFDRERQEFIFKKDKL